VTGHAPKADLPDSPWILHTIPRLGNVTDRWIDLQARMTSSFDARLLGLDLLDGVSRKPHWIVASDRLIWRRAYQLGDRVSFASAALGSAVRPPAPSILHAHFAPPACAQRGLMRALHVPLVVSVYGYDVCTELYRTHPRWQSRYRRLWREAAAVIAEGPAMAERVQALGCPSEKVHIIRLAADADGLAGVRAHPADEFRVVAAGQFIEKKGFDMAIRAFARALRGRDDARLAMVGGGELEPIWRRLAFEEGISEQVLWQGRLPFHEFMTEIGRGRVAVYPSRTAVNGDSEGGAPVTLIEAQWLGVPSLISDHDDLPFVAAPGGTFVLPGDAVDQWAECLRALYDDSGRLQKMGTAAAAFVRERHAPDLNRAERENLYRGVLG
jgi:colanic acid/amylovoran biosynthesis glycosyltransferase